MTIEVAEVFDELLKGDSLDELKRMREFVLNYSQSQSKTSIVTEICLKLINAHISYKEIQLDESAGLIPEAFEEGMLH